MKRFLFGIILLMSIFSVAQTYVAPEPIERQIKEAQEFTLKLDNELSLTEKQILLVEKIRAEFVARRDAIIGSKELTIDQKNNRLKALYLEEGREMADVLVRVQINKYSDIRGELQPLVVIKK